MSPSLHQHNENEEKKLQSLAESNEEEENMRSVEDNCGHSELDKMDC